MLDPDKAAKLKAAIAKMGSKPSEDKMPQGGPEGSEPEVEMSMEFDPMDDAGMNPDEPEEDDIMPDEEPGSYSAEDLAPEEVSVPMSHRTRRGMVPGAMKKRLGGLADTIRRASGEGA